MFRFATQTIFLATLALLGAEALGQRVGPIRGRKDVPQNLPPIVRKALEEAPKLRYAAEMTVEFRGSGPSRSKFKQIVWKDGRRTRIERPDNGEIVVENGTIRRKYNPSTNEIEESRGMRDEVMGRLIQALRMANGEKGKIATAPGPSIAGRPTEEVSISDGRGNPIQKLWIDVRTGMIMKREIYDRVGSLAGLVEVTKIDFNPTFRPTDFEIRRANAKVVSQIDIAKRVARKHGFLSAFLDITQDRQLDGNTVVGQERPVAWILHYQTNQGMLSLVQSKEQLEPGMLQRMSGRGRNVYQWQLKGRYFALIGEMPVETLRSLASQVQEK